MHETGIARWALGDPGWPKSAMAFGGKFGIDDDTETPNTLTAGFSYGNEQLVVELQETGVPELPCVPIRVAPS